MATAASKQDFEELVRQMTPVSAPADQREGVRLLSKALDGFAHERVHKRPGCQLLGPRGELVVIPESVFYVLERVAQVMARGDAITVVPVGKQVTTQQAADILNVSRQYLVRLLEAGELPFTRTGKHRRIRIEDVLRFKEKRDAARKTVLDELARLSEEYGGYEETK